MTEPIRVDDVDTSAFAAITMPVQVWADTWRGTDRVMRYRGDCIACGVPTWSFDDGENDPRGAGGMNTLWSITFECPADGQEYEVLACSTCANDHGSYNLAQQLGREQLRQHGLEDAHSIWKEAS